MSDIKFVTLKPGKEKAVLNHHHWIFSGAIQNLPNFDDGDILQVRSSKNELLGSAYFNKQSSLIGRMICFDQSNPLDALKKRLDQAIEFRNTLFDNSITNAYRLINGEGDGIPGLIIDKYSDALVIQIGTLGIEKLKDWLVDYLIKKLKPKTIFEKSQLPSRKEEGLSQFQALLYGEDIQEIVAKENGLNFNIQIVEGQKTGFFLDHREMRSWVRELAKNKKVLNCFSYTGAFSVSAMAGGAKGVDSVDISDKAIEQVKTNYQLNRFDLSGSNFLAKDVFQFLREDSLNYDLIILDPPAFAKRQKDVIQACRGYKDINRIAMSKQPPGTMLLTASCSYHVNEELFQKILFQASLEAKRNVRIIGKHRIAKDHPINICHPESDYLKSFLLYIE